MDFLKRRFSTNTDPDKDTDEKPASSTLLQSLSSRRATLWSDFRSKIKSDKLDTSSPADESDIKESSDKAGNETKTFMESVREKLHSVRLYENGHLGSDGENCTSNSHEPECAPLIDTTENSSVDGDSNVVTGGESEVNEAQSSVQVTINGTSADNTSNSTRKKRLYNKRQDSLTAEEIYLETVATPVRDGVVESDKETPLISPSKAVQEFAFTKTVGKNKSQSRKKNTKPKNSLQVANGNLMNFDSIHNLREAAASSSAETVVHHEDDGVFDYESSGGESSEPVYTEFASSRRSNSLDSINSIESAYEDEESLKLKQFAFKFVENMFSDNSNSAEDKARFGKCVQRANRKAVTEHTFYQLVQYFAVVLFECDEADDYTPATILMNMCFTFYYEASRAGNIEKNFLSTYLKNQPIWQSMRYWNAAFYESVQNERVRKPLTTNSQGGSNHTPSPTSEHSKPDNSGKDNADDDSQDRVFQENIIFGQLGTYLYNMRAFGLNMEWCLEFLRKQATVGNLTEALGPRLHGYYQNSLERAAVNHRTERINMLRESVESVKMD